MKDLQQACAVAEGEMEKFWSKKIQFSNSPEEVLRSFIYYDNYQDLTRLEYALLASQNAGVGKVLFVGS